MSFLPSFLLLSSLSLYMTNKLYIGYRSRHRIYESAYFPFIFPLRLVQSRPNRILYLFRISVLGLRSLRGWNAISVQHFIPIYSLHTSRDFPEPIARSLTIIRSLPAGWVVPIAIFFIISFPPVSVSLS